jgi:hypothetical protein
VHGAVRVASHLPRKGINLRGRFFNIFGGISLLI